MASLAKQPASVYPSLNASADGSGLDEVVLGWGVAASFCLPLTVVGTPGLHTLYLSLKPLGVSTPVNDGRV